MLEFETLHLGDLDTHVVTWVDHDTRNQNHKQFLVGGGFAQIFLVLVTAAPRPKSTPP